MGSYLDSNPISDEFVVFEAKYHWIDDPLELMKKSQKAVELNNLNH